MSDYKMVPVEPTPEMLEAGKYALDAGCHASGIYADMLASAPAVQGEPSLVAWVLYDATADQKYIKASDDGALAIFDSEAAARRARTMHPGTDYKRCEYYTATQPAEQKPASKFKHGDPVRKIKGSQWKGRVVGTYSTDLTPEGYAVESDTEKGSVQIYPAAALEMATDDEQPAPDVAVVLVEALQNMLGAFDTPIIRRKVGSVFSEEAIGSAHTALAAHRKGGEA